jgi:hypothetical protein
LSYLFKMYTDNWIKDFKINIPELSLQTYCIFAEAKRSDFHQATFHSHQSMLQGEKCTASAKHLCFAQHSRKVQVSQVTLRRKSFLRNCHSGSKKLPVFYGTGKFIKV